MSATHPLRAERRMTGWHVLAAIVLFFAVVMGVDGVFTVMAVKTFPGAVSVTPYEDGLIYNRRIAQVEAQAKLGWRAAAAAKPGVVVLQVKDREGQPVRGLAASGKLERPATETGRVHLRFTETAPGTYEAPAGAIAGAWDMTAEARDAKGQLFTAERRLSW